MQQIPSEALRPFIDEFDIKTRIQNLVMEIATDLRGNECFVVGVLKKSFVFLADIMRQFHSQSIPISIDFISLSAGESDSIVSDRVVIDRDITMEIRDKWVLLVDDVLDTGHTAAAIHEHLSRKEPKILKTCILLDKLKKRVIRFQPDYVGFTIPDVFAVGYGLGYSHRCRELPSLSIAAFEEIDRSLRFSIKNNRLMLDGSLDEDGADHVRETLMHWKGNLQLDLSRLETVDTPGLDLLSEVQNEMKKSGWNMALFNIKPGVRETILNSGYKNRFQIGLV